ncbi:hypothetical protein [Alloprevotella tannerae]|uniref:hypothetical protein n=1 Tax=Alloprevotella tannerae TaxID=76122 RepID=UPI00288AEDD9|nr:hypothetical protein [Alloprevotella tannerae]
MKKVYARERTLKRVDGGACGIDYIRQNVDAERTKNKGRAAKKSGAPCRVPLKNVKVERSINVKIQGRADGPI